MKQDDLPPPEDHDAPDLLRGGMFYAMLHRFGVDPVSSARTARRAVGVALLLWVPAAALALAEGHALPGQTRLPLLLDVAFHVRALLAVPLLLVAKPVLATAWRQAGARFKSRGLLGPQVVPRAEALVERVTRSARRLLPTLVCLLLAAGGTARLVAAVEAMGRDTWYAQPTGSGGCRLTLAGWWHAGVIHTAIFCLTLGWLWRMSLWYRFLWGLSRLGLTLFPTHPDRAAGLGFVGRTMAAAAPLTLGWSAALGSSAANLMLHEGQALSTFVPLGIVMLVVVLLLFVLPPLVIFAPLIIRARREALEEWGKRMAHTGEGLRRAVSAAPGEAAAAPVTGLEDLQIAVSAVRNTLPLPFELSHLVPLLAALAIPALALVLLAVPFGEVLDRLFSLLT